MPGKVIGTSLGVGYPGTPSRMQDVVISPYKYPKTATGNIAFGEPVVFNPSTGGIRKLTNTDTGTVKIIGFAVRRMGQPHADTTTGWYYEPGDTVDVLLRGSIVVPIKATTSLAAGGAVYACNGSGTNAAGDIVAASSTDTVAVPNAVFGTAKTSGTAGTDAVVEVTITGRSI